MNRNKLKIIVLLLAFVLVCAVAFYAFYRDYSGKLPEQTSEPSTDTSGVSTLPPVIPTTTEPIETTEETTEATTEPTTAPTTEATTVPETTEAVAADVGLKAAQIASAQVGKPYQYGSAGPDAFDTSGLVQYCYQQCGISIPRSNSSLAEHGYIVDKEDILPGDAVFFWSSNEGTAEYLGIYIGNGMVVAALNSSKPVTQFDMNSAYYTEHFVFARRFY